MPKEGMERSQGCILTIDLGTTNGKCVIFAADGSVLGRGKAAYGEHYPEPGWVEQVPEDWWAATVTSVRQALSAANIPAGAVQAISVTGQMHGVLAIDARGQALTPCLTLRDRRATREAGQITTALGLHRIYHLTGARLAPSLPVAKIAWIRSHQPQVYKATRAFLPPKDYLRYLLTGDIATEVVDAAGMLLYDVRARQWSDEMARAAGLDRDKLPAIRNPWEVAGGLARDAAQALGLVAGTPVVIGAGDDIEFLGFGLVDAGAALEHMGTTGSIMACIDRPAEDPDMTVELYPHIDPSLWLVGGSINAAGGALDWAFKVFSENGRKGPGALLDSGLQSLPSVEEPLIFLPYLAGERCPVWDPDAKSGWFGLTMAHDKPDLLRAVLEGVTFALKHVLEKIESMGVPVADLAVQQAGKGLPWLALRANAYGKPLRLQDNPEPTALGAMIVAGVGIGLFSDLSQGVAATRVPENLVKVDQEAAARYERLFALYKEVSSMCHPLFSRFAQCRADGSPTE